MKSEINIKNKQLDFKIGDLVISKEGKHVYIVNSIMETKVTLTILYSSLDVVRLGTVYTLTNLNGFLLFEGTLTLTQ